MITRDQLLTAFQNAVDLKGEDYVYRPFKVASGSIECVYAKDGEPSCIVGYAINELDPEAFKKVAEWEKTVHEDSNVSPWGSSDVDAVAAAGLVEFEPDALELAEKVQYMQDRSEPWGDALAKAVADTAKV